MMRKDYTKLTSSGVTTPFMSTLPFKCFPGPMRIACRFTALKEGIQQIRHPHERTHIRHLLEHLLAGVLSVFLSCLGIGIDNLVNELAHRLLQTFVTLCQVSAHQL